MSYNGAQQGQVMDALQHSLIFLIFIVFAGAAFLCTIALYTRQSMLVAYMLLGFIVGPFELKLIPDAHIVTEIGEIGIIFLLFLLGLHLQPKNLIQLLRKSVVVSLGSSVFFAAVTYLVTRWFGYSPADSLVIGVALLFSSTIIGLKLLPTTVLHHRHTGELMVSILLLQDLIAIVVLMILRSAGGGGLTLQEILTMLFGLPILVVVAFVLQRHVLVHLLRRFNHIKEYIFLLPIGWCLSFVVIGKALGLSSEVGAFIAGVALAEHPISQYIAEKLQPLRDFFLIAFFFSIGATFDPHYLMKVILPAAVVALLIILFKPVIFRYLLVNSGESNKVGWEVGWRLGQASEFSLLVAYMAATTSGIITESASYLIQAATIITFVVSSYIVLLRYPSPVAFSDKLRRD